MNAEQIVKSILQGNVKDVHGEPLIGVTIRQRGSTTGTVTDVNGNFKLTLPEESTIEASYIGYQTQNIKRNGKPFMNIVMIEDQKSLDEVVVVGYGTQTKRDITGAVSNVKAEGMADMPVNQFAQQLQGKVAGVQINQYSGQPGRGIQFRIRGAASLFASNQPLVVVDGLPITGSINNINPAEIESFSVLKDASSTSLYGSRAANGVIMITTKQATTGKLNISFDANYGIQKIPESKQYKMMNAREFAEFQNEYYEDRVKYEHYKGKLNPVYENPERYGEGTNWFKTLTRTAPIQSYNLTVRSGSKTASTVAVAGYSKQDGVILNTSTQLFSLRLNQKFNFDDKLLLTFSLAPSYRKDHNNRMNTDGLGGLVEKIFESSPLVSPVNEDGTYPLFVHSPGMVSTVNPYAVLTQQKDDYATTRILANANIVYNFLDGFFLKTNFGIDKGAETRNRFFPSYTVPSLLASGYSSSVDNYSWTADFMLGYQKTLAEKHNFDVLLGYSAQKFNQTSNNVSGTNFPSDDVEWLNAATVITDGSSNTTDYSLLSQLARFNYNYDRKYIFSAAIRRDGSSRFGANKKYGYFPSVSVGWVVSDENFWKVKPVNFFKVRMSYGVTGNNNIGNYTFMANMGQYNYVSQDKLVSGGSISSLGNTELAWERNKQFDVGFDMNFLNNRLTFTYDYYRKVTDGLIMDMPVPRASGFTSIKTNVGVIHFWGHEFSIHSVNFSGVFNWTTDFNISFDRNKVKSLVSPGYIRRNNTITSDYYRHQEGCPLGQFYGFVFDGLYKDADDLANSPKYGSNSDVGTIKMKDVSGPDGKPDGKITNEYDRTFIGDPTPDFIYGMTNNFSYKGFDLSISMAGSVGGKILNPTRWAYLSNLDGARMMLKETKDRWRSEENPGSGKYPRTKSGTTAIGRSVNSQWIENGSYLSVKNISMGYKFNLDRKKAFIDYVRLYMSIQNALTFTGYKGANPEVNVGGMDPTKGVGIDENAYPVPRTISFGVNVGI